MTTLSRRGLITGLVSFAVTAPSIVRATSLMPVKLMIEAVTESRFNGSIAGTTLVVTAVQSGELRIGDAIRWGIDDRDLGRIVAQVCGQPFGLGSYILDHAGFGPGTYAHAPFIGKS